MEVEIDLAAVGDEYSPLRVEAFLLQLGKLLEKARNVEDDAGTDKIDALRIHEAGGEQVEAAQTK